MNDEYSPRPSGHVEAASCELAFCDDPSCGVHILSYDKNNKLICETVMSSGMTLTMIKICQDNLYDKASRR